MLILLIIIILILYLNKKEFFTNYNYQGPIIFLQEVDFAGRNCLNEISNYQCIGKHPDEDYYPSDEELKHLNEPNIVRIPRGKKGLKGSDGSPGENKGNTYRKRNNDISKITSNNDKFVIKSNGDIVINNESDIKLQSYSEICINNTDLCIDRKDIEDIIRINS